MNRLFCLCLTVVLASYVPICAQQKDPPKYITNSLGMKLVSIPPGKFMMGSPPGETPRLDDAGPLHEVEITRGFHMGVYEVTQDEYRHIMGTNTTPSYFSAAGPVKAIVAGLDTSRFAVEPARIWSVPKRIWGVMK